MLCTGAVTISQMTNKHKKTAWGLYGGADGLPGATLYQSEGANSWTTVGEAFGKISTTKYSNVPIRPGERVSVKAPGGGGYGAPGERDPRAVVEDVLEGYVSTQAAARDYGYEASWIARHGEDAPLPEAAE